MKINKIEEEEEEGGGGGQEEMNREGGVNREVDNGDSEERNERR